MTSPPLRGRRTATVLAVTLAATATAALVAARPDTAAGPDTAARPTPPPGPAAAAAASRVIVRASSAAAAAAAVRSVGGDVIALLPIADAVAARVPVGAQARLRRTVGGGAVTPDGRLRVQAGLPSGGTIPLPVSVYGAEVGAGRMKAKGVTGAGVTVALLDTGVAASPDFSGRLVQVTDSQTGKVSNCENLSGQSTCTDQYGHGTFLAGLIAGNGASSGGRYVGVAPGAKILSIKVGGPDGSADVSNVLAGIQWAVTFRSQYKIKVLNLSLGTDSTSPWTTDPLNYAVERAWAAGITVVVSASNRGPTAGTISKPADDPYVITVGAVDDLATASRTDDMLPDFSGRGPTADGLAKPDVVAPGAHLVSLRAVGSTIDVLFPTYVDTEYRQGSGTSMSAAVVSGVVALMLAAKPTMVPDRVKYALMNTAHPVATSSPTNQVGRGLVDAYAATYNAPAGTANAGLARSSGLGDPVSLDATRGGVVVRSKGPGALVVNAALTAQLLVWDPGGTTLGDWSAPTWVASPWYTAPWFGTVWYGDDWQGHNWEGASYYGTSDPARPYGHNWEGSAWYGAWD